MADLTELFMKEREVELNAQGPAAQEAAVIRQEEEDAVTKRKEAKFQGAYDQTDLSTVGPSRDIYNYQDDYENGNTLKPDDQGGVQLNNAHFKPESVNVGGYDLATGKKYQNKFKDEEGHISKGIEMLKKEDFNTKAGPSYRNSYGLFEIAQGVIKENGSYDDFKSNVNGPWSEDQMAMAYSAAHNTRTIIDDTDTIGKRYYDQMREDYDQFQGRIYTIPPSGYTEETLATDENWLNNGRELLYHVQGASAMDLSDEDIDKKMKAMMTLFNHNLPMMMTFANMAENDETGAMARALLVADEQYEALEMSSDVARRTTGAIFGDVTNYITLGGGILVTQLGKQGVKEGIKHSMKRLMHGLAYDFATGTAFGATFEAKQQDVEIAAGTREERDLGMIGTMGLIEGGANVVIGGPLNVIGDKNLRGFAGKNMKEGYNFIRQNMKEVQLMAPPGPKGQAGHINFGPIADPKVEQVSALQNWIKNNTKEGMKIQTVRQNLRAAVKSGQIKQQELDWSGVNEYLDNMEARGEKAIGAFHMLSRAESQTPVPKLVNVVRNTYGEYSLLSSKGGTLNQEAEFSYRERMLVIPAKKASQPRSSLPGEGYLDDGTDIGRYAPSHFGPAQADQLDINDNMIGHSRVENAETYYDGGTRKGKMVLEIQSDYHKAGQQQGYKGEPPKGEISPRIWSDEILNKARDLGIDPHNKNAMAKLWPHLSEAQKRVYEARVRSPEKMPYGKDWDTMGMRLEIMDSINNGDEFIAWPATAEQINVIEQWGPSYTNEGLVKRATTNRVKALKKMGLEVEQINMPQYKGIGKYDIFSSQGADAADEALYSRNQVIVEGMDNQGNEIYELYANPEGILNEGTGERGGVELLRTMDRDQYIDFLKVLAEEGQVGIQDTTFNVIRLTDEVKKKFLKEGMPNYAIGAFVPAAQVAKQPATERDENGRFKKK